MAAPLGAQSNDPAMESYYAANALYNKNLYQLAVDEYKAFIAKYPKHEKHLHARFGLALSLYEMKRFQEAEPLFGALARERDSPRKEQVYNLWGQCLLMLGKPAQAEEAFLWSVNRGKERLFLDLPGMGGDYQEAPELSATAVQDADPLEISLVGLVEALFQQRKWQGVIDYSQEFVKIVPKGQYLPRVLFQQAFGHYELQQYPAATEVLENIKLYHKNTPFYEHAVFLLAECQRETGQLDVAARNHEIVAREIKGDFASNALFRLAFIRFSQKQYDRAAADFEDLRLLYPESEYFNESGIYLGRSHLERDDFAKAQSVFGELTNVGPVASEATLWLAKTFLRQSNYKQALDVLRPALRKFAADPNAVHFVFEYGVSLMGVEQYEEAIQIFERVVNEFEKNSLTSQALRLRAYCLMKSSKHEESLKVCDEFIREYSDDPAYRDVAFMRAENVFFLDRYDEAIRAYQQFIPWENRTRYTDEARYRIIQIMVAQKRWPDALAEIGKLRSEGTIKGDFFEQIDYIEGLTYFNLERWDSAIESLERFIKQNSLRTNADIAQIKLAQAYESKRDLATARMVLEVLVRDNSTSPHIAQALAELGRIVYNSGDYEGSKAYFERVSSEHAQSPFFAQSEYYLGWIALNAKDSLNAIAHFEKVSRDFPDHDLAADSQYKKALLYLDLGQTSNAQIAFKHFMDYYPNDKRFDQASFYFGRTLVLMERFSEAIPVYQNILNRSQDKDLAARSLYELAWCHQGLQRREAAKARYEDMLKQYPDHELARRAQFELAEIEYDEGLFDASIARLDVLLAGPLDVDLREKIIHRMAWCLLGRGQDLAAAETFEMLLRDFPETTFTAISSYQAGEVRLARKEYKDALPLFERAVKSATEARLKQQAMLRQGETHCYLSQWQPAETVFAIFLEEYGDSEFVRRCQMWLGWAQENLSKHEQAIANYRMVLRSGKRDELSARSQFQIGQCLVKMGEPDQAVRELVLVDVNYAFPVWSARALLEIGRVLDQQGRIREAGDRYKEVILKFPGTDEAIFADELLKGLANRTPSES